jgi:hypothetical protein
MPLRRRVPSLADSPLGHREKPAYECPRLADPSRYPAEGKILTPPFNYCTNPSSNLACFLV